MFYALHIYLHHSRQKCLSCTRSADCTWLPLLQRWRGRRVVLHCEDRTARAGKTLLKLNVCLLLKHLYLSCLKCIALRWNWLCNMHIVAREIPCILCKKMHYAIYKLWQRRRYCVTWRRQNCTCFGSTYTLSILHCCISKYTLFQYCFVAYLVCHDLCSIPSVIPSRQHISLGSAPLDSNFNSMLGFVFSSALCSHMCDA